MTPPTKQQLEHLIKKIRAKRKRAKNRKIQIMSFYELLALSLSSRHWKRLGPGPTGYCFCRKNHSIGYTPQNTFIGSNVANQRERLRRCPPPGRTPTLNLTQDQRKARKRAEWRRWRNAHLTQERLRNKTYKAKKRATASTTQLQFLNQSQSKTAGASQRLADHQLPTSPARTPMTTNRNSIIAGTTALNDYAKTHPDELAERGRRALADWKTNNPEEQAHHSRRNLIKARAKRWPK